MKNKSTPITQKRSHFFVFMLIISALLSVGGYLFYKAEAQEIRENKHHEIKAIADLKIQQIVKWRQERKGDINVVSQSSFFVKAVKLWMNNRNNELLNDEITERLLSIKQHYSYEEVLLATKEGELLFQIDSQQAEIYPLTKEKIIETVKSRKVTFTDFYECKEHNKIHYDIIAPLIDEETNLFAVFILRVDPNEYLYPLIQTWPTISKTSETLLVRKENNKVLFLNELRHRKNTALKLTVPVTSKEFPAVQAVQGHIGIFEGKDYRGVDVLAYVEPVPDTRWYIIAKVDKNEIYAELDQRAVLIAIFILVMIFLIGLGLSLVYNSRQKNIYKQLFHKEKELRESQEEFRTTLYSIGDAVITTDKNGIIKQMNFVAEQLTGWKEDEAKDKSLENVFNIINEENRKKAENPVARVLKEGIVVGLANHTLLISKDGVETPIADSGAPIRNEEGEIIGVVLVFRDQIQEREHQLALQKSEEFIRSVMDNLPIGIAVNTVDPTVEFEYINDNFVKFYCTTKEAITKADGFWEAVYEDPEFREEMKKRVLDDFITGNPELMYWQDIPIIRKGKETRYITARNIPVPEKNIAISTVLDVTDRKLAELEITRLNRVYALLSNTNQAIVRIQNQHELFNEICRIAVEDGKFLLAWIGIVDDKNKMTKVEAFTQQAITKSGETIKLVDNIEDCQCLSNKVLETGNYFVVNDIKSNDEILFCKNNILLSGCKSASSFPIYLFGNIVGTLNLFSEDEQFFHDEEIKLIDEMSKDISFALEFIETDNKRKLTEDKLLYEQYLLHTLMDYSPDYIYFKDDKSRFIRINKAQSDLFGLENPSDAVGKTDYDFFTEEHAHKAYLNEQEIISSGKPIIGREEKETWPDGKITWASTSKIPLRNSKGEIIGTFGISRNITDRKSVELALRESEAFYYSLVENIQASIFRKDKEGRFVFVNSTFCKLKGLSKEEIIIGKTPRELASYELTISASRLESYQRTMLKGEEDHKQIMSTGKNIEIEEVYLQPDGSKLYYYVIKTPIIGTEGEIIGTQGIQFDITRNKKVEEEIKMLAHSIASINECVTITDKNDNIIFVNEAFVQTYGYTKEELIGNHVSMLRPQNVTKEIGSRIFSQTINIGWKGELLNVKKDGTVFPIHLSTSVIKDENSIPIALIGVATDITESKKAREELVAAKEHAEKSDRLKSEFLAQMSHEIRSPLNVTLSYANLIREELGSAATPDFIEYFDGIESAGKRLIRTVDLILNNSEMQVGTYEPTFVELNLIEDILESVRKEYAKITKDKGLELKHFYSISKANIYGDKYSIYQIFVNLIDNAVKYTNKGTITISVSENINTNQVVAEIEDTGIGMSEEFIKIMFEPFAQEEQGYSRRFEGNGLGLTLVKKYCDLNGIEIKVESEKEKGSKFTMTFNHIKR